MQCLCFFHLFCAQTSIKPKKSDRKLVTSKTSLLYNYFFTHTNEDKILKIKKYQSQYNRLHRIFNADVSYVQDRVIQNLQYTRGFVNSINIVPFKIKTKMSLVLLVLTPYTYKDNSIYYKKDHQWIELCSTEYTPKRNMQLLIQHLTNHNKCLRYSIN